MVEPNIEERGQSVSSGSIRSGPNQRSRTFPESPESIVTEPVRSWESSLSGQPARSRSS